MRASLPQRNLKLREDLLFLADSLGSQKDGSASYSVAMLSLAELRQFMCVFFCANDYADLKGEVRILYTKNCRTIAYNSRLA